MGRPLKPKRSNSRHLNFLVEQTLFDHLQHIAALRGMTLSELVRHVLRSAIDPSPSGATESALEEVQRRVYGKAMAAFQLAFKAAIAEATEDER